MNADERRQNRQCDSAAKNDDVAVFLAYVTPCDSGSARRASEARMPGRAQVEYYPFDFMRSSHPGSAPTIR
jgi:hypothetical protein